MPTRGQIFEVAVGRLAGWWLGFNLLARCSSSGSADVEEHERLGSPCLDNAIGCFTSS